jgi:hypothetical protein
VNADLRRHIQDRIDAGASEEEAVEAALAELGSAERLGQQMKSFDSIAGLAIETLLGRNAGVV